MLPLLMLALPRAFAAPAAGQAGLPLRWQPPLEIATGAGLRGPWQQNDSRYDFVDDPSVVLAGDGSLVVAWVDQARKALLVQRRRPDGSAADPPVEVARAPQTFSWIPRLALVPGAPQRVLVLWQEIIFSGGSHGGEMMFARSDDGGRSFSPPLNLSRSRGGDGKGRIDPSIWHNGSYELVADADGRVVAAWTEYDGMLWVSASQDGGRSFAAPRLLAGADGQRPTRAPALAVQPGGAVYLAWTEGDNPAADIRVARSEDGGATFAAAQVVAPDPGYADAPSLALDRQGTLHLAFGHSESGPLGRQRILYTRSADGGRSFEPPRAISTPLPRPHVSAGYPSLAVDGRGGVYVVWELHPHPQQRPRGLGMAVSADAGARFSAPVVVPGSLDPGGGTNGSSQGLLLRKLAVNGRGEVAVVNSSLREGSHSRVWLIRGHRAP
ncbi:sialidase family protein [Ramlibacter sp. AN1015]|uniref:sialidase family protein n=1 Tax=Ramlibacter sp. AN1015 TaxID=3133428 RepID=UPI0030C0881A